MSSTLTVIWVNFEWYTDFDKNILQVFKEFNLLLFSKFRFVDISHFHKMNTNIELF